MTRKARKPEEIEKIRESILLEALDIISRGGYSTLTMRDLAARVKMTSTNIYNYFSSKDEIYLMLAIKGFQTLRGRLTAAREAHSDPESRARSFLEAYFRFGMDESHYYDIMFSLPMPRYRDYLGTELESTAQVEMDLSDEIIKLSLAVVKEMNPGLNEEERLLRLLHIWSILHGIISLTRSKVLQYVSGDIEGLYRRLVDEFLKSRP